MRLHPYHFTCAKLRAYPLLGYQRGKLQCVQANTCRLAMQHCRRRTMEHVVERVRLQKR